MLGSYNTRRIQECRYFLTSFKTLVAQVVSILLLLFLESHFLAVVVPCRLANVDVLAILPRCIQTTLLDNTTTNSYIVPDVSCWVSALHTMYSKNKNQEEET